MFKEQVEEESCLSTFKANSDSFLLIDLASILKILVFEIKFRNLLKHPKDLSIQLLFKVLLHNIRIAIFVTQCRKHKDVTKISTVILMSFLGVLHEIFQFLVDHLLNLGILFGKVKEDS